MPHFIIDCNQEIIRQVEPGKIMDTVYHAAKETGLFPQSEIKVRINPFEHYRTENQVESFIHVFGNIMQGRTDVQKMALSKSIVAQLSKLFPDIPVLSMNIRDFERSSYYNKSMI